MENSNPNEPGSRVEEAEGFRIYLTGDVGKLKFLLSLLLDPVIFSGFVAAFLGSLAWMAVMTKFELSHAYPFMSLNFVIVLFLSSWLLDEPVTLQKILGIALIVLGTVVAARG